MSEEEKKELETAQEADTQEEKADAPAEEVQEEAAEAPAKEAEATEEATEEAAEEAVEEGPSQEELEAEFAKKQAEEEAEAARVAEEAAREDVRPGMTIRVHQKIQEGDKERIQVFQGIVTAKRGATPETRTITVQKNSYGIMVDKIFPLASPLIEKIEVVKVAKVRRSKLNFLSGYRKRLKETFVK